MEIKDEHISKEKESLGGGQTTEVRTSDRYVRIALSALVFGAIGYYAVRNKKTGVKIGVTVASAMVGSLIVHRTRNYISKTIADSK